MIAARAMLGDDRILLRVRGIDENRAKLAKIAGAEWSADKQLWSFPLSMANCRALRTVYKRTLDVMPDLSAWAREALLRGE